ncbi:oxidoreductase domain-containing protein [Lophium mytilinum]|uniref:D-xylose 1-dehydrogenase (NADP(+), D-xylono-1,5-lactone-forming) n=1 Tax=Lophium mytilinum TaxID=390894 RepID=A0A6A6QIJ2_9PEZI|nr:oxidoreductase domain-containing protein [Lophium mytilinum]
MSPPVAPKKENAIRFGLFGASWIAPNAIIGPSRSHPEVIVAAIASRDKSKAQAYAKKHGIPIVHDSYEALLADSTITAVYIPLPNGLHYEWAVKSLKAGKHVLLEKPSTSNAIEAASLFNLPLLSSPDPPVLLEAFHYRFHPAWQTFLSLFDGSDIASATVSQYLFAGFFPLDDIRFNYSLAGGTLMDFGTYALSTLRQVFRAEPVSVISAEPRKAAADDRIDEAMRATYEFPGGAKGSIEVDLQARGGLPLPWLTAYWPGYFKGLPTITVKLKEQDISDSEGPSHVVQRAFVFTNYMMPTHWHRIEIIEQHTLHPPRGEKLIKKWTEKKTVKVYRWLEEGQVGEEWWSTYRYQLEEFVNRVKKREGSGVWIDSKDSIKQLEMIDATYLKAGLPLRPTSTALE